MTEKLEIFLATPHGFCAGVDRAIQIVEKAIIKFPNHKICVLHEIVHNRYVLQYFKKKGVAFIEDIAQVPDGAVLIFSAHGVSLAIEEDARKRDIIVIDATCPLVTSVHRQVQRYEKANLNIIMIGHSEHVEVKATTGRTQQKIFVVNSITDIDKLSFKHTDNLAYITQTTLSIDDTREIITALRKKFPYIQGPELRNICFATQNRQNAVKQLVQQHIDMLLVIGAQNSSNSNRLRELGEVNSIRSYLIDDYKSLNLSWLNNIRKLGITSGASAPEILLTELLTYLKKFFIVKTTTIGDIKEKVTFKLPSI